MADIIKFEDYRRPSRSRIETFRNDESMLVIIEPPPMTEDEMQALLAEGLAAVDQMESIGNLVNRVIMQAMKRKKERETREKN